MSKVNILLYRAGFLILMVFPVFTIHAQESSDDEMAVKEAIDEFFYALEVQDSTLFMQGVLENGQSWYVVDEGDNVRSGMRYFKDRKFDPETVIQETPLSYDIRIHERIAVAWVPYTLDINDTFSHCGVDVFTLFKMNEEWKILNISFTVEPEGCAALE